MSRICAPSAERSLELLVDWRGAFDDDGRRVHDNRDGWRQHHGRLRGSSRGRRLLRAPGA